MNPMFYFLLPLTAVLAATANAGKPILDSNGYRVITNASYYARPLVSMFELAGGGLTLNTFGVNNCPFYVGKEQSEFEDGIPVKFSDWESGDGFVPESENLNIEMDVKDTVCFEPTYWRISTAPVVPVRLLIKTGPKSSNGLFQIRKSEHIRT
ncbi:kunitz trypsin inhibitor 1 [Raphanus sativus]|uniref:Kunitz trypsin inhibitor 4-like n=1 Tax=Raphanus sativus TaxID=3726 RepID=A0A6J0KUC7_RAPSA|nr:kunitz trypsin inhibitor 4-like [Raphanus sativus]XP_056857287.1 kunitz trypsin inhibitor 4-like [Raphanus sativus]KAJ4866715.1 kunitz trypsin inhibitor 1 [Raphanus sativus]KAJ4880520.1 kunitz trypsin inhibitor 1 [Raphanus sativus]